eukprot:Selendium_serpulae@DN5995_c1_g2_i1.p2
MGRKKRRGVQLKPFCYYCEREFDDEKVLIQHQKAKHFKCQDCNRKLDTASGLVVHMLHVHKDTINKVPNAMEGRDNPDVVVHGMEGVPDEIVDAKQQTLLEEKGLAKHMKSAHTVFGMETLSGMGFLPGDFMPVMPTQPALPMNPFLAGLQGFPSAQPFLGLPAPLPFPVPTPVEPAPVNRPSGIAINSGAVSQNNATTSPERPAPKPTAPAQPQANAPPPLGPNIVMVYSDDTMSVEEMVAMQKYNYPVNVN